MSVQNTKYEIGLVVLGAALLGGGSILLRFQIPAYQLPYNLRQFQYSLGFLMLGLLALVAWQTRGATRKTSIFLTITTLVALGMPPEGDLLALATNVVFALTVVLLGVMRYSFSRGRPSTRPLVASLLVVMLVLTLYGEWYLFTVVQRTENLRLALGMIALLAVFFGYSSMLWRELSGGGSGDGFHERDNP